MEENCLICNKNDFVSLIVKVVDFCNFECEFCRYYLEREKHHSSLELDTFEKLLDKACEYNVSHGHRHLTVIFHGGEPLLWGYENFEKSMKIEEKIKQKYSDFKFHNSIQTNGSLISDKWALFLKNNNFSIGISIDGPENINFHRNKAICTGKVLENIRLLTKQNCKYGILSVITEQHRDYSKEYYDFLVTNNIHNVGFCYCFDTKGENSVSNETLSFFLINFFELYYNGNFKLHVREFEFAIKICLGIRVEGCTFSFRRNCGNYFAIRPNGDICFCDSYDLSEKPLGNILKIDFEYIKKCNEFTDIISRVSSHSNDECDSCEIHNICGGGCARHILTDGKHAFCDTYKILYPHIYAKVNKLRSR